MGIIKYIQLLVLPVMICHSFWNPFTRWGRQTNCGYYMPSYMPSYCTFSSPTRNPWPAPSFPATDGSDQYAYLGHQASFRPFLIGQSYYRGPSYFPYYYNNRINSGYSKNSWQPTTFSPIVQQSSLSNKLNVPDQQFKIKSYR